MDEATVVAKCSNYLRALGYTVDAVPTSTHPGFDIEGSRPDGSRILVEAKGIERSRADSFRKVADALYVSVGHKDNFADDKTTVAIALPDTTQMRERIAWIRETLEKNEIMVLYFSEGDTVDCFYRTPSNG